MIKYFIALTILLSLLVATHSTANAAPSDEYIVLVHGWDGLGDNGPDFWYFYTNYLRSLGYNVIVPNFGSADIPTDALQLKSVIDTQIPPNAKVHVVGQAIGGITARYYMKYDGGSTRVATLITLDSSHYGRWDTCLWWAQNCALHPLITGLNTGDDTPGPAAYVQLRGKSDPNVVYRLLDGGVYSKDYPLLDHISINTDPIVRDTVVNSLKGIYPPRTNITP